MSVRLDDVRALRALNLVTTFGEAVLRVNGQDVQFPVRLEQGQALTAEGPGGVKLWPRGMRPGQALETATAALQLKPGDNTVTFSCDPPDEFPGDLNVLLYRLWPMEE